MTQNVVRCPYCVLSSEFRPMVAHVDGRFICNKCGHITRAGDTNYKCNCPNCQNLRSGYCIPRAAS
jgi:hypothetical protein